MFWVVSLSTATWLLESCAGWLLVRCYVVARVLLKCFGWMLERCYVVARALLECLGGYLSVAMWLLKCFGLLEHCYSILGVC